MKRVNSYILLQALSRKPLEPSIRNEEFLEANEVFTNEDGSKVTFGVGNLLAGLEDESVEVRLSTIDMLAKLSDSSKRFRERVQEVLLDMLNDGSTKVRVGTLHALLHMALNGGLVVQETHLHMIHDSLKDVSLEMQNVGRKLIAQIQLESISSFKLTIQTLLHDINRHGKVDGIFDALQNLGKSHSEYVQCVANELVQEASALFHSVKGLDEPRYEGILSLFIGAAESDSNIVSLLPSQVFSYARIMRDQRTQSSRVMEVDNVGPNTKLFCSIQKPLIGNFMNWSNRPSHNQCTRGVINSGINMSDNMVEEISNLQENGAGRAIADAMKAAQFVRKFADSGLFADGLCVLSGCRRDLKAIVDNGQGATHMATFSLHYVECLRLIIQSHTHRRAKDGRVVNAKGYSSNADEISHNIRCMKYLFSGHTEEQSFLLHELSLIPYIWKTLASADTRVKHSSHVGISSLMVSINNLIEKGLPKTAFIDGVKEFLLKAESDRKEDAWRLATTYWPSILPYNAMIAKQHVEFEFLQGSADFVSPLVFLPGMPLGITILASLSHIRDDAKIWVHTRLGTILTQYSFLDHKLIGSGKVHYTIQIYDLPDIPRCSLKISVLLECPISPSGNERVASLRGPIGPLLGLSQEKEINLISTVERARKNIYM